MAIFLHKSHTDFQSMAIFLHKILKIAQCNIENLFYSVFFIHTQVNAEEKNTVVIGMDINCPPMGFLSPEGKITGFDVELASLVFKKAGMKVKFQPIDWDAKELELNSGKIDAIWNGLSKTAEREKTMLLTSAYMHNDQAIIVAKNSKINSIEQLKGKGIVVQKGSTGEQALQSSSIYKQLGFVTSIENMVNCLNEVDMGKVDATIVDSNIGKYYLKKNSLSDNFKILKKPLASEEYVVAVKKGNTKLKNIIEKGIAKLVKTGQAQKISQKWFGENVFSKTFDKQDYAENDLNKVSDTSFIAPILQGLSVTMLLFIITFVLSVPLGFIVCIIRRKNIAVINFIIDIYVNIMRGTPLLLQLFFIFYGLPYLPYVGQYLTISDRFIAGLVAFVVNYVAYFAEIFRGGFASIPKGQFEAAKVLGFTKIQTMLQIAIPQILKVTLPTLNNEAVTLLKDTALVFAIGVTELLAVSKNMVNSTANVGAYLIAFVIYLVVSYVITFIFKKYEKKYIFE